MSMTANQADNQQTKQEAEIFPRNIDFELGEDVTYDWHSDCPGISNMWNGLSLLFPEGETFFVKSAQNYLKIVKDPVFKKELKGFMTQEMIHTREHVVYNDMLKRHNINTDRVNAVLKWWAVQGHRYLPKSIQLAITVSLEHWTATLAQALLDNPQMLEDAHPKMRAVWNWHAIEETEHKAVCFDLLKEAVPNPVAFYLIANITHIIAAPIFIISAHAVYLDLMASTGNLSNFKAHWSMLKFNYGLKNGLFRRAMGLWFDFMKPGFHPWDHDNRHHIAKWDEAATGRDTIPAHLVAAE